MTIPSGELISGTLANVASNYTIVTSNSYAYRFGEHVFIGIQVNGTIYPTTMTYQTFAYVDDLNVQSIDSIIGSAGCRSLNTAGQYQTSSLSAPLTVSATCSNGRITLQYIGQYQSNTVRGSGMVAIYHLIVS